MVLERELRLHMMIRSSNVGQLLLTALNVESSTAVLVFTISTTPLRPWTNQSVSFFLSGRRAVCGAIVDCQLIQCLMFKDF